jgi:predicted glycoside hydrolase/deacetylase ChbG (UPF0249 family)
MFTLDNRSRYLIANADDFGLSPGTNAGIIHAHEDGIVTSASLMVRKPAAWEAAEYARAHPEFSIGLHLDLGEWSFVEGSWKQLYEIVPLSDSDGLERDVARQLELFRHLMGRNPTHLDSHQHVHHAEPLLSICSLTAAKMGIPLRSLHREVRYCGDFYGQSAKGCPYPEGISVDFLLGLISSLPPGITELGCHPGHSCELVSTYRDERPKDCETLCDPCIRAALEKHGVALCSFSSFRFAVEQRTM